MTNPTHVKSLITEGPVTVGEVFEVYSVDPTGSVLVNDGVGGMWTLCQGEYEPYTPLDELAALDNAEITGEHKTFGEMTSEEKGALLLAHHRGEEIESHNMGSIPGEEWSVTTFPSWTKTALYRIKPKTVIEERVGYWVNHDKDWDAALPMKETYRDGKLVSLHWEAEEDK